LAPTLAQTSADGETHTRSLVQRPNWTFINLRGTLTRSSETDRLCRSLEVYCFTLRKSGITRLPQGNTKSERLKSGSGKAGFMEVVPLPPPHSYSDKSVSAAVPGLDSEWRNSRKRRMKRRNRRVEKADSQVSWIDRSCRGWVSWPEHMAPFRCVIWQCQCGIVRGKFG
jgi:hypothetical protein